MRLLQRQDNGSLTLTTFSDDNIPPYAILSHTWGEDDEEVTFREITEGVTLQKYDYTQKKGYRKIDFCANSAASDKLQYFWVDSCCIDKSSSAELQEAITSMFRWYQNAAKCYVYLSDVFCDNEQQKRALPRPGWDFAFRKSRWFTRGWTLQELLAPRCVEFFSADGYKLGSRPQLDQLLQEVTGIAIDALQGKPLSEFSCSERMSWARGRDTKRKEDKAYSLLGIFDVSMRVDYGEGEKKSMDRLSAKIDRRWSSLRTQESHFMVPFGRNENFIGRDAILEQLLQKIPPNANKNDCQRTAIEGLGGIGKTQIALEAAYRVRDTHPDCSVFWVPAIDLTSFENAYREIGQLLRLPCIGDKKADVKMLVKTSLSSTSSWLLIVDNADDLELSAILADYLPFSREGSILFTTRNHKTTTILDIARDSIFAVPEMDNGEATDLLQKGLRKEQIDSIESTQQLLGFLTNLPLAIKQASAFMTSNTNVTISEYLEICKSSNTDLIEILSEEFEDRHRYRDHAKNQNPVATTWLISFENISRHDPQAADYLKFMCFLAEKDIPVSLLPVTSKIKMKKAIGTLKAHEFITERDSLDAFDIHRLVRFIIRNWLQKNRQWTEYYELVIQQLVKEYPFPDWENRQTWTKYLPHAEAVLDVDKIIPTEDNIHLLYRIAAAFLKLEKFSKAERLYQQALGLSKEALGKKHLLTISCMTGLASVFYGQEKYKEAEEMYRQVLRLSDKQHPLTFTNMNNLANVLHNQGKYEEAEEMYRRVIRLEEDVLGKEHPSTLSSMNDLANVFYSQGKYEEAEKMDRQVIGLKEDVLGKKHSSTLLSMGNLASVLYHQGKYEEAEKMDRQVIKLEEDMSGKLHPSTLISISKLANVLYSQGKYEEAEKMYRQVKGLSEDMLGKEHPTLFDKSVLAIVLHNQRKYEDAEKMHRQVQG
ncbi:TPR-like protein [Xylaria curta]|nr:TPR-like protein [Xylaria curta]